MKRTIPFILIALIILTLAGCGEQSAGGGLRVWLDVPLSGLTLPVGEQVKIEGHAASKAGLARIEISINGSAWQVLEAPACQNDLCSFSAVWQPDQPGVYTLQIVAVDVNGEASEPDEAVLVIGATEPPTASQTPTPEISITPTLTPTSTSTHTPTPTFTPTITVTAQLIPQIQFWAEPAEIAAGKCTAIKWNAVNVKKVQFGGIDQPLSGADEECPCVDKTYTLVVTLLDNSIVERTTSVDVSGTCTTPKPPDTTPPPVPSPQVPSDGLSLACKASQTLAWLPVTDPSGIQEYQVRIQRSSDNINWNNHPASPITGLTDKTTSISIECGWYYRWSVRVIDGAGNASDWSGWFDFVINLS